MTAKNTIRLLNLPRAASIVDIRKYFWGMFIPEGGVLIVGGEKGEAFVTFKTDEDAKRALYFDGGYIKSVRVTLMLSSHDELRKIYEYTHTKLKESEYLQSIRQAKNYASPILWNYKFVELNGFDNNQKLKPAPIDHDIKRDYYIRSDRSKSPITKVSDAVILGSEQKFKTSGRQFSEEVSVLPVNYHLHQPLLAFTPIPAKIIESLQTSLTSVYKPKGTARSTAQMRDHYTHPEIMSTNGGVLRHRLPTVITQPYPIRAQRYPRTVVQ